MQQYNFTATSPTVDGRSPANQLRLVYKPHYLRGVFTSQVVVWDFFHQQYSCTSDGNHMKPTRYAPAVYGLTGPPVFVDAVPGSLGGEVRSNQCSIEA